MFRPVAWSEEPSEEDEAESWTPPGENIHSYKSSGKNFEIWRASLADERARNILANMRIFISFFIEGGTCNFLDDPTWSMERWKIYLLYEVLPDTKPNCSKYCFAGFSTSYRNWVASSTRVLAAFAESPLAESDLAKTSFLEDTTDSTSDFIQSYSPGIAPSRERISQFLILPPYQHQSHGTHLYNTITDRFLQDRSVFEITVEDPNEAFDDLRDYCDLARLVPDPLFANLRLPSDLDKSLLTPDATVPHKELVDSSTAEEARHKYKIARRQFDRLLEIHLLSAIEPGHRTVSRITRKSQASDVQDRQYYFWRLLVKLRLLWQNKDVLMQVDADERVTKLEETLVGLQEEYERLLKGLEKRNVGGAASTGASSSDRLATRRKRAVESDTEDEDADDGSKTPMKKVKT